MMSIWRMQRNKLLICQFYWNKKDSTNQQYYLFLQIYIKLDFLFMLSFVHKDIFACLCACDCAVAYRRCNLAKTALSDIAASENACTVCHHFIICYDISPFWEVDLACKLWGFWAAAYRDENSAYVDWMLLSVLIEVQFLNSVVALNRGWKCVF